MNKRKISVIFAIILIFAVLVTMSSLSAGLFKSDSEIKVLTNKTLNQDEKFIVQLNGQGQNLTNKTVHFKLIDKKGHAKDYNATTNKNGKAKLKLKDVKPGNYTVNVSFDGDDKFNGANATQKIKVKKVVVEQPAETQQTAEESYSESYQSSEGNEVVDTRDFVSWDYAPGYHIHEVTYANGDVERDVGEYHVYYDSSEKTEYYTNPDGSSGSMHYG
jgi:hypothetical protein